MAIRADVPEQMLISSVLINNDMKNALANGLSRQMFAAYSNEYIWLEDYYIANQKEPATSTFRLQFPGFDVKKADDTPHWVSRVRDEYSKRNLLVIAEEITNRIAEGKLHPTEVSDWLQTKTLTLTKELGMIDDGDIFTDNVDVLEEFAARRKRYEEKGFSGIPTSFDSIDGRGGFDVGLTIVAARTGGKKSWFMHKCASAAAREGYRVQFNALEQSRTQVTARVLSLMNDPYAARHFASRQLMQGHGYDPDAFKDYLSDVRSQIKLNGALHVADTSRGGVSVATIASQIERNKPDIVYVDYLDLMDLESYDWMGLGRTAAQLTQLANKYQIPIVLAMQLNRSGVDVNAGVETLAGSDGPGRYASLILFLRNRSERVLHVRIAKNRDDGEYSFFTKFVPDRGEFREIDKQTADMLSEEDDAEQVELESA